MNRPLHVKMLRWALSIGVFFLLWEIVGRSGKFISIVPPTVVIPELIEILKEGDILVAARSTLALAATGFVIGAVIGISTGAWMAASPRVAAVLDPIVSASFSVPFAIFIPVISIYLGLEFTAKVVLVVLFNVFIININTATGIREVPAGPKEMARSVETSRVDMYRKVILPLAFPGVVAGSIFTFSLTLGDFIVPLSLGNSKFFIGQAVYSHQGTSGNIPLAAAFTMGPVVIMLLYLLAARKLGAFDAL